MVERNICTCPQVDRRCDEVHHIEISYLVHLTSYSNEIFIAQIPRSESSAIHYDVEILEQLVERVYVLFFQRNSVRL